MSIRKTVTSQGFEALKVEWAREQLVKEVRSGFPTCRFFDAFKCQRHIELLSNRSKDDLETLARVLPLQVLFEPSMNDVDLNALTAECNKVVEKLRVDYHNDFLKYFDQHIRDLARKDSKEVKLEFNVASRQGNALIKQIAARWNCEVAGAARGEWGLIFYWQNLRMVISIKLSRNMELGYDLSISETSFAYSLCFHDHYMGVLGIGASAWFVANAEQFPEMLEKAAEFAFWHQNEYVKLIDASSRE